MKNNAVIQLTVALVAPPKRVFHQPCTDAKRGEKSLLFIGLSYNPNTLSSQISRYAKSQGSIQSHNQYDFAERWKSIDQCKALDSGEKFLFAI